MSVYRTSKSTRAMCTCCLKVQNGPTQVTLRSTRAAPMYEPGHWVSRVSPTPLLRLTALKNTVTLTDTGSAAYEQALHPKRIVTSDGGHFDAYRPRIQETSSAAQDWFLEHPGEPHHRT